MSARGYRAVVFDMDGVLVDSEPAFFDAVNDVLAPTGKHVEWEQYRHLLGTSISVTWRSVLEMVGLEKEDPQPYVNRFDGALIDALGRQRDLLPGVQPLLDELARRGAAIGVATSSRRAWIEALFAGVGLTTDAFGAVVCGEDVDRSKPAPDIYLRASQLLAVEPGRCIAIEDTPPGIEAARAAGMYAVQVRASSTAFPPIESADLVIDTLAAFPLGMLDL